MKKIIFFIFLCLKAILYKLLYGKKLIFLLGTPMHGNLGDIAIAYAEEQIIKEIIAKPYFEIPSSYVGTYINTWKKIIGKNEVFVHGGGFTGTIWPEEMDMLLSVLRHFRNNKIIILPQTVYFEVLGSNVQSALAEAIDNCTDLTILLREHYSKEFVDLHFKTARSYLVPDVVPYLDKRYFNLKNHDSRDRVLFGIRNDKEKIDQSTTIEKIKSLTTEFEIDYTDTVVPYAIRPWNRLKEIENKIAQFRKSKLVVTDRLHGMVFATIAEVPCIVLNNNNYKIKGVYEWIKHQPNIYFLNSEEELDFVIPSLLKMPYQKFENNFIRSKLSETISKVI